MLRGLKERIEHDCGVPVVMSAMPLFDTTCLPTITSPTKAKYRAA